MMVIDAAAPPSLAAPLDVGQMATEHGGSGGGGCIKKGLVDRTLLYTQYGL